MNLLKMYESIKNRCPKHMKYKTQSSQRLQYNTTTNLKTQCTSHMYVIKKLKLNIIML